MPSGMLCQPFRPHAHRGEDMQESSYGSVQQNGSEQRIWITVAYILHLLGAVLGAPSIVALICNSVLRSGVDGPLRSLHDCLTRTYCWRLRWTVLTVLLALAVIGIPPAWLLGVGVWLWWLYRHVRGR